MKKSISTLFFFLAFFLFLSPTVFAQSTDTDVIVIQQTTTENGTTTINLKKGEEFKTYVQQIEDVKQDGKDIELKVISTETTEVNVDSENDETIFIFKSAKDDQNEEEIERIIIKLNEAVVQDIETSKLVEKKPLLGVYSDTAAEGVLLTGIVYNSGAQKAGLKKGDILTALNGEAISSPSDLSTTIAKYKVGDQLQVDYIRDGVKTTSTVTLGARKVHRTHSYRSFYDSEEDRVYNSFQDRNPCTAFIGVYTSRNRAGGLRVHNIIANTPAEKAAIQTGDIIIAIDDVEVSSHRELVAERDKHVAGDFFTLSVLRDGQAMDIDAQFDACPEEEKTIFIEKPEVEEEEIIPSFEVTENTLDLEELSIFPNPTYGPVNLKFKGEAVPTTIRVVDTSGKVVYEEVLNNFDGIYNKELPLKRPAPGTMILTVQQGQKVYTESLVLLTRA